MTLEEIEARWKAATPGPWAYDSDDSAIWNKAGNCLVIYSTEHEPDGRAIAAAPTDIACLLDRVRKERESHNESIAQMHDELARYKRAHAFMSTRADPMSVDFYCDICDGHGKVHEPNCEWLKAKELRL